MHTIADIHKNMKKFDNYARRAVDSNAPEALLKKEWKSLFDSDLNDDSARSFIKYYRSMRSKQSGGSSPISMAPLDYTMTPGINPGVYGRFPVAINSDPQSIQDLDVYFQNSLLKGCGTENSSLTIPEGMGSNMVGGSRKHRKSTRKVNRKVTRKVNRKANRKVNRKANRKANRKSTRKAQRGGLVDIANLATSLYSRPYTADAPPNILQTLGANASGATSPAGSPSSPSDHTWQYVSNGTAGIINPGNVSFVNNEFARLANPSPWQTQV